MIDEATYGNWRNGVAKCLGDQCGLEMTQADAAVVLVDEDTVNAEVCEFGPDVVGTVIAGFGDLADAGEGATRLEIARDAVLQHALLFA